MYAMISYYDSKVVKRRLGDVELKTQLLKM